MYFPKDIDSIFLETLISNKAIYVYITQNKHPLIKLFKLDNDRRNSPFGLGKIEKFSFWNLFEGGSVLWSA